MPTKSPTDAAFDAILSEGAERKRRNLLIASLVTVLIVVCGLVPERITGLGVELSKVDRGRFVKVLAGMNLFLLAEFAAFAIWDLLRWGHHIGKAAGEVLATKREVLYEKERLLESGRQPPKSEWNRLDDKSANVPPIRPKVPVPLVLLKMWLDLIAPLLIGILAVGLCIWEAWTGQGGAP